MKEVLKSVKAERKKEKETPEDSKADSEYESTCKICDQSIQI